MKPAPPPDADALAPEPALALLYAPAPVRAATATLWRLDQRIADVALRPGEPTLTAIKLAWWEEALATLGNHRGHGDPLLGEAADLLLAGGLAATDVAQLAAAWRENDLCDYAAARASLFTLTARLARCAITDRHRRAAEGWALVARACGAGAQGEAAMALARARFAEAGPLRWPRALRSLGALSALARRDAAGGAPGAQGAPARIVGMLRVRLTGFDN